MSTFMRPLFIGILFYLDPGSGSFLIQLLLAVILGAGVAIRLYWGKIKALFRKDIPSETDKIGKDNEG